MADGEGFGGQADEPCKGGGAEGEGFGGRAEESCKEGGVGGQADEKACLTCILTTLPDREVHK